MTKNIVCTFLNEPPVVLDDVPEGTRWVYVCRDPASKTGQKLVTWDHNVVGVWMADPARAAPWIEPQEVFGCQTEEVSAVEMDVERVAAE